jgi:hypothetical protein
LQHAELVAERVAQHPEVIAALLLVVPTGGAERFKALDLGLQPARVRFDQARLEVVDVRYDAARFGSGYRNRPKTRASIRPVPLAPTVVKAVGAHYRHTTPEMLARVVEVVEAYLRTALAPVPQACPKPKQQGRDQGSGHRRSGS